MRRVAGVRRLFSRRFGGRWKRRKQNWEWGVGSGEWDGKARSLFPLSIPNVPALFLFECGRPRLRRKKLRASGRMFFSTSLEYATTNVMMASRSQNGQCRIELER